MFACEHKFCMIIAVFNLQHRTKPMWHVYTGHRKSERQSGRVQVISEHFSRLYIRDGSRFSNIRIFYLIIEYRLGCAIIF